MSDKSKHGRSRLRAHVISPLPAALGLLSAGAVHATAVAVDDNFNAVLVSGPQSSIGNVLSNDTGGSLTATPYSGSGAYSVSILSDGTMYYSVDNCTDAGTVVSVGYTVDDSSDASSANGIVNVTFVLPGIDDTATTSSGAAVTFNVRDNDLPTGNTRPVASFTQPSNGSVIQTATNGQFTYTPTSGFSGVDEFSYNVQSGIFCNAAPVATLVDVTVNPVAVADTVVAAVGAEVTGNVLTNDKGSNLVVISNTQPAHGSAQVVSDGTFYYFPDSGFSGTDSFQYTVETPLSSPGAVAVGRTMRRAAGSIQAIDPQATGTVTIQVGANAQAATVPTPATGAGALGLLATLLGWFGLRNRRRV